MDLATLIRVNPLAEFWRWWSGALADVAPPVLRRSLGDGLPRYGVRLREYGSAEIVIRDRRGWKPAPHARPRSIILLLPETDVAVTEIASPRLSERELRSAALLRLDTLSPLPAAETAIAAAPLDRERAVFAVARAETVRAVQAADAPWREALNLGRAKIALVSAEGLVDGDGAPLPLTPSQDRPPRSAKRPMRRLAWAAAALAMAMGGFIVGAPIWRTEQKLAVLSDLAADQAGAIERAVALRSEIDALAEEARFLAERRAEQPPFSRILAAATAALPDSAHLTALRLSGDGVLFEGEAQAAAEALSALDAAAVFREARFAAESRKQPTGGERFAIAARVELGE